MQNDYENIVYSKNVLEFISVAKEYCLFIEAIDKMEKDEFLSKIQKFLPLLYLKATMLPQLESINEDGNEKFVNEAHWTLINQKIHNKLNDVDTYSDSFDSRMNEFSEESQHSISEDLTDIYQDMKDLISLYVIGTTDIMNDAIWECKNNFELYWGFRLVSASKAIHLVLYNQKTEGK